MDPRVTLYEARGLLLDGDEAGARAMMREYRAWRKKGGFEPMDVFGLAGDIAAGTLEAAPSEAERTQAFDEITLERRASFGEVAVTERVFRNRSRA